MNNRERNEYRKQWELFRKKQEKYWKPKIFKALQTNNKAFAEAIRKSGIRNAIGSIDSIVSMAPIMYVLQRLYIQVGLKRGRMITQQIKRDTQKARGTMGYNEELTRDILKYFELNLLNKSVIPITQTQKDAIMRVLEKGIQQGYGVEDLAKMIEGMPYTRSHAALVVSTEVGRAANAAAELSAAKSELYLEKEWISAHDNRVRRPPKSHFDHVAMDGITIDQDKPFNVSGEQMMFPCDPNGSAGNVIRCRCAVAYTAKRDTDGRLMRRPKPITTIGNAQAPAQPISLPPVGDSESTIQPTPPAPRPISAVSAIATTVIGAAISEAISELFE